MASEHDDLTNDERRALIEHSRFPLSERIRMLKRIRLKLRRAAAKERREPDKPGDDLCVEWTYFGG
jgi:hypothetical protein